MRFKRNTRLKTFMVTSTLITSVVVATFLHTGLKSDASINKTLDLSQKQLLELSSFMYISDVEKLQSIQDRIDDTKTKGVIDKSKCTFSAGGIKPSQGARLLKLMENDEILSDLVAVDSLKSDITAVAYVHKDCVGQKDAEAVVVFQGTKGYNEPWLDNLKGTTETDTQLQLEAGRFMNRVMANYKVSHVTGHSKGGNLAQYVTITSGEDVRKCISFNGQGFSNLFKEKYSKELNANAYKITSISSYKEPVHVLLDPIATNIMFIKTNENVDPLTSHFPLLLLEDKFFDENGTYKTEWLTDESSTVKAVSKLSSSVTNNTPKGVFNCTAETLSPVIAYSMSIFEQSSAYEDVAFVKALYREFKAKNAELKESK